MRWPLALILLAGPAAADMPTFVADLAGAYAAGAPLYSATADAPCPAQPLTITDIADRTVTTAQDAPDRPGLPAGAVLHLIETGFVLETPGRASGAPRARYALTRSAGGVHAFVADAICQPGGDCRPLESPSDVVVLLATQNPCEAD